MIAETQIFIISLYLRIVLYQALHVLVTTTSKILKDFEKPKWLQHMLSIKFEIKLNGEKGWWWIIAQTCYSYETRTTPIDYNV